MIYKMYASVAATTEGAATIDIQDDCVIEAIAYRIRSAVTGADGGGEFEVSFSSSAGHTNNDTRASIFGAGNYYELTTSGAANQAKNGSVSGLEIDCAHGERLHLHVNELGTADNNTITVWLYTKPKRRTTTTRRRTARRTAA